MRAADAASSRAVEAWRWVHGRGVSEKRWSTGK